MEEEKGRVGKAPRILLCGDVLGRFDLLCKRLSAVNKANGPFDVLFCVGQFFSSSNDDIKEVEEYIDGKKMFPMPTYFIGNYGEGSQVLHAIGTMGVNVGKVRVCDNLFWLKGSGLLKLNGLSVAYLAGKYDPKVYKDAKGAMKFGAFHEDDVDALRAFADNPIAVDFFFTNEWPHGVSKGVVSLDRILKGDQFTGGNTIIAELASDIRPRYHIAGSEGIFYAREPYENEGISHVTRFIGLGAVGNDKKQKFLHALSPTPSAILSPSELALRPSNTSKSPYGSAEQKTDSRMRKKREVPLTNHSIQGEISGAQNSEGQYWRYDSPQAKKQKRGDGQDKFCFELVAKGSCSWGASCNFKHELGNGIPIPRHTCFDFLTKGKCERGQECNFLHVSKDGSGVGDQALGESTPPDSHERADSRSRQKSGPRSCWFCLSSPDVESHLVISVGEHCYCALAKGPLTEDHVLILPVDHLPSSVCVPLEVELEFEAYSHALRRFFKSQGKALVIFERFLQSPSGSHAHLQAVPIQKSSVSKLSSAFMSAAEKIGFDFKILQPEEKKRPRHSLKKLLDGGVNYFYVELPDGTMLVHPISPREKMPMQFGREVLASLLGVFERGDWRSCSLSKYQEVELVRRFREVFQEYDVMQMT